MRIDLPKAKVVAKFGSLDLAYMECSRCGHTSGACFCAGVGYSRQALNGVAVGLLFGYDLSKVDPKVVEGVREVLNGIRFPI
jgi:hypothetical protein